MARNPGADHESHLSRNYWAEEPGHVSDEFGGETRFRANLIKAAETGPFSDRISIVGFKEDLAPV